MKSARRFAICSTLAGCFVSAAVLACLGKEGWAWFLFVGILLAAADRAAAFAIWYREHCSRDEPGDRILVDREGVAYPSRRPVVLKAKKREVAP